MALLLNQYGQPRIISASTGESSGPMSLWRVETVTATTTTNKFTTYLTDTGISTGRKLFSGRPAVFVNFRDTAAGANAAVTDFYAVTILAYDEATGQLDWLGVKIVTTTPTIMAVGDGAFEFNILAFGPPN